jgi:hypothetical protein
MYGELGIGETVHEQVHISHAKAQSRQENYLRQDLQD